VGSYFVDKVSDTGNSTSTLQTLTVSWHGSRDGKSNVILYSDSLGKPVGLIAYESNGDVSHCKIQPPDTSQVHWSRYPTGGGGTTFDTVSIVFKGSTEAIYESSSYIDQEQIALQFGPQASIKTQVDSRQVTIDSAGSHQINTTHGNLWWVPAIGFIGKDNNAGTQEEIVAYKLY